MKLKDGILIAGLFLIGAVNAQVEKETEPEPREIVRAEIIDFPDVEAQFPGGPEDLRKFIQENFKYPEKAIRQGDQGRVYISFVVEIDGSITGVEVMRGGLTPELNEEAKRLISVMPPWKPAEIRGTKVRARCRIPITFHLSGTEEK